MIKEIKLKSIYINDKKKDGSPYIDKNGNPFKMAVIESDSGSKASMFCGKFQANDLKTIQIWKAGDTVRVNLEKSGEYINFSLPSKTDELLERVEKLEKAVFTIKTPQNIETTPTPEKELTVDDIPF